MSKRISLSDLQKKLLGDSDKIIEQLKERGVTPKEIPKEDKPMVAFNFFADGAEQTAFYCHYCNNMSIIKGQRRYYGYYSSSEHCPKCDKTDNYRHVINVGGAVSSKKKNAYLLNVDEEKKHFSFNVVTPIYRHDSAGIEDIVYDGKMEFLKGGFNSYFEYPSEFVFSFEYGLRFFDSTYSKFENISSNAYYDNTRDLKGYVFDYNDENIISLFNKICENYPNLTKETTTIEDLPTLMYLCSYKIIESRKRPASAKKEKKTTVNVYESYKPRPLGLSDISSIKKQPLSLMYESICHKDKYVLYCKCGHIWNDEFDDNNRYDSSVKCPECGEKFNVNYRQGKSSITDKRNYVYYDVKEDTKELLLRFIRYAITLNHLGQVYETLEEYKRIFVSKDSYVAVEYMDASWKKVRKSKMDASISTERYISSHAVLANDNKTLTDAISKSQLNRSGLLEAWGLIETPMNLEPYETAGILNSSSYLPMFIKHPYIEIIYKAGLKKLLGSVIRGYYVNLNPTATNIYDLLGILKHDKPVLKMARAIDADSEDIELLKKLFQSDHTITLDLYKTLTDRDGLSFRRYEIERMIEIRTSYNITYQRQLEYLDSCFNYQCIHKNSALQIWADYLKMASEMHYRLKDREQKFPSSLKREHDKAVFSYEVVRNRINQEKFIEQAKQNMQYEYEGKKYKVVVPKTPEDVIQEGTSLKHCVASYVERVRTGSTVICFIRDKENPNDSFFTSEVFNEKIYQVKGFCNTLPKDEDLIKFINKWAEARNLAKPTRY